MSAENGFKFPEDFIRRIELGEEMDDDFLEALGNLTTEQRGELAEMGIERRKKRTDLN